MASLAITFDEIRSEVGFTAGYGRDASRWGNESTQLVLAVIRNGIRRFLFGTPLGGKVYDWSFLRQRWDFATVADKGDYELPADFGSPDGPIYFQSDQFTPIAFINESRMEHLRSLNVTNAGTPCFAAVRYKPSGGSYEQGRILELYPTPTGADTLRLLYRINGEMLTSSNQYPPGGAEHSRTVLYACLAELARRRNLPELAMYEADYIASFQGSISTDVSMRGPIGRSIGDQEGGEFDRLDEYGNGGPNFVMSVNGVTYE